MKLSLWSRQERMEKLRGIYTDDNNICVRVIDRFFTSAWIEGANLNPRTVQFVCKDLCE